ncbi:MAG: RNA 3'-terminal phosphate cyclase [candidate division WOR-3 bacterium]|nr:RNA 3'-terminal phosphate cyclase [candidate division WOR-3 bacterium]MDH5683124.1 RNA 3'-terminal phosphate cyclase [candidate division WOR-3 bacterium]
MIKIDGSYGEGGGQILRTALSLSAILNKPFEMYNIRKGRKKPGLLAQHLTGVNATQKITDAKVSGNNFGSLSLIFEPKTISGGEYEFNVAEERGSAGAVTLVTQTILPILFFADKASKVTIKGGTHVPFSPPFDYLKEILLPLLAKLGFEAKAELKGYGFYPVGEGEVTLEIKSQNSKVKIQREPFAIKERGELKELKSVSSVANLPLSIAERQNNHLTAKFKIQNSGLEIKSTCETVKASCSGTHLFLTADFQNIRAGFSSLGARGKPAEKVADEVFDEFSNYFSQKGALDPHLADQILIFLALAQQSCASRRAQPTPSISFTTTKITDHLLTNIWVINQFLPELKITVNENLITVER